MANYSVDIEVALKGVDKLRDFERIIKNSVNELNKLEKALKNVKQQNPYDVSGARRVTELDKLRLNIIKETNRALSEQERIQRGINSEIARQNLATQVQARRAAAPGVQRRTIAGVAYPEGAGPGMGPMAQRNIDRARMQRVTNARITTAYPGPIGPGPASPAALRSPVARRIEEALARQALIENAGFGVQGPALPPARPSRNFIPAGLRGRIGGAVSGGVIGGAFPLLFGQGGAAATGGAIGGLLGGLAGPGGSFAGSLAGTLIGNIAGQGQQIKQLAEDIGFSAQQTKILSDAFKVANTDVEKFTGVIQNIRGLGLDIQDQGRAIQLVTELTNKYGGSFEKVGNAITSALESGKVSQATLNQLTSQGINVQGALATKYGVSRDAVLKMAKDGTISVQDLIDTLVDMGNKGDEAGKKPKSSMDALRESVRNLQDATSKLASALVTTFGPVFKWLTDRVTDFINAVSRAVSRLGDLMKGGRMTQATILAERTAETATTKRFGVLSRSGIPGFNKPEAQAFYEATREAELKRLVPGAFAPPEKPTPLESFTAPSQASATGAKGSSAAENKAKREMERVREVIRAQGLITLENQRQLMFKDAIFKAEIANDPILARRLQGEQQLLEWGIETANMLEKEKNANAQLAIARAQQAKQAVIIRETEQTLLQLDMQRKSEGYELQTQLQQEAYILQQTLIGKGEEARLEVEIANAVKGKDAAQTAGIATQIRKNAELTKEVEAQQRLHGLVSEIGNTTTRVFQDLIFVTNSWQESLAGALNMMALTLVRFGLTSLADMGDPTGQGVGLLSILTGRFGKRAAGGPVSAGSPYLVGERGPELFMPRTSGSIYPNDAMGMGGANIVVNVDAGGSSVGGDLGQANQLGKAIGIAVQQELIKQKRPGGLLA